MNIRSFLLLFAITTSALAQHLVPQPVFDAIANEYSGEAAQENDRQIVQYHRIQGSPMMAEVAEKVALAKLKAWGIESKLEQFPSDGKTRYQTYISPMGWDMRGGELWVESVAGDTKFVPFRLCRFSDVPMCVSTYSKGGEWSGELVEVGAGTSDKDYEGKDVHGKVALAYGYAANVVRQAALKHGAVGVVIYPPPGDRADHPGMVRYNGIWPRAEELEKTTGGFQISGNQYTELQGLMRRGAVRVRGKIDATLGPGQLTLVHAWIRGSKNPETEVLITGHLDHPKWSANDNASGSAAMLEMARTLHALIAAGKLAPPQMTIHFMWVPEYFGSVAYVTKHPEARACNTAGWDDPRLAEPYHAGEPCIAVNLNLDMVGEDTVKTDSRFYITRTPDSVPEFLNALMADVLAQTREANIYAPTGTRQFWPAEISPYVQGSDHDVFLGLGIPSTMLGHDPDWTHHTSEDTIDKTDASEFRRVGVLALAAAYWPAVANGKDWEMLHRVTFHSWVANSAERVGIAATKPDADALIARMRTEFDAMRNAMRSSDKTDHAAGAGNYSLLEIMEMGRPGTSSTKASGLHRLTLLPIDASTLEALAGDDKKWWDEQESIFSTEAPGGGLPPGPSFDLIAFEATNFLDGKRGAGDIADLLTVEFNRNFDAAWVERLFGVLGKLQVVAAK